MTSYMGVESVSFILFWWNIYNSIIVERFKYQLYSLDGQIDDSHHWGLSINDLIWLSGPQRKLRKFPLCRANLDEAIIFPNIFDFFRSFVYMSLIFWRLVDDDIMLWWCRCTPAPIFAHKWDRWVNALFMRGFIMVSDKEEAQLTCYLLRKLNPKIFSFY